MKVKKKFIALGLSALFVVAPLAVEAGSHLIAPTALPNDGGNVLSIQSNGSLRRAAMTSNSTVSTRRFRALGYVGTRRVATGDWRTAGTSVTGWLIYTNLRAVAGW